MNDKFDSSRPSQKSTRTDIIVPPPPSVAPRSSPGLYLYKPESRSTEDEFQNEKLHDKWITMNQALDHLHKAKKLLKASAFSLMNEVELNNALGEVESLCNNLSDEIQNLKRSIK